MKIFRVFNRDSRPKLFCAGFLP